MSWPQHSDPLPMGRLSPVPPSPSLHPTATPRWAKLSTPFRPHQLPPLLTRGSDCRQSPDSTSQVSRGFALGGSSRRCHPRAKRRPCVRFRNSENRGHRSCRATPYVDQGPHLFKARYDGAGVEENRPQSVLPLLCGDQPRPDHVRGGHNGDCMLPRGIRSSRIIK